MNRCTGVHIKRAPNIFLTNENGKRQSTVVVMCQRHLAPSRSNTLSAVQVFILSELQSPKRIADGAKIFQRFNRGDTDGFAAGKFKSGRT